MKRLPDPNPPGGGGGGDGPGSGGGSGGGDSGPSVSTDQRNDQAPGGPGTPTKPEPSEPTYASTQITVSLLPVELAVDANRDGTIKFSGNFHDPAVADKPVDKTEEEKPFRFWLNDDQDDKDIDETIPVATKDYTDNLIKKPKDLEDFTRLHLFIGGLHEAIKDEKIKVGLKWKDIRTNAPAVNVAWAKESDGGIEYLKDEDKGNQQVAGTYGQIKARIAGTQPTLLPVELFQNLSATNQNTFLLFEGAAEGKGQLVTTIHDISGAEIGEGPGVWLDLKDIKKMYVRKEGYFIDYASPFDQSNYRSNATTNRNADSTTFEELPVGEEEDKVIVFVHGIHGPFENFGDVKKGWYGTSETVFKRLWWQGYKGRFASYKWDALQPAIPFEFNESEYRGWCFGNRLAEFVDSIPKSRKSLMAHSQGNTLCGNALRYSGLRVENYALMQAAVPAGCYDSQASVNNYQRFIDAENNNGQTPDWTSDMGYRGYLPTLPLNVTGKVVNFHNKVDYALATGTSWLAWFFTGSINTNWEENQVSSKPQSLAFRHYSYDPNATGSIPGDPNHKLMQSGALVRAVEDEWESMAFLARSRSQAVGARATGGSIQENIDLNSSPYNFTRESSDHGGEFGRPIQKAWDFYTKLFEIFGD